MAAAVVPGSRNQATNKTWELSLYELHRQPQPATTDDTEIAVPAKDLHTELMCPICLDLLRQTMTTKECLHRFCHECIITALRSGNKECPTCRKKLISKRSLRPDPNFDALMSKIYPCREDYEQQQDQLLTAITKHHNNLSFQTSIEEGLKMQAQSRTKLPTSNNEGPAITESPLRWGGPSGPSSDEDSQSSLKRSRVGSASEESLEGSASDVADDAVEIILKPRNTNAGLTTRFLKTTCNASIEHIKRYLALRLPFSTTPTNPDETAVYIITMLTADDTYTPLPPNMTLETALDSYWNDDAPLEMYYAIAMVEK